MDITTIFFDFDGVVADTEPLYDIFWRQVAEKYHIGIPDFPAKIKGTTLQRIYELYFSDYSSEELGKITRACDRFEGDLGKKNEMYTGLICFNLV